jgi:hypothetical protein
MVFGCPVWNGVDLLQVFALSRLHPVAGLHDAVFSRNAEQRGHQVQEADIQELSADEFESMLASSEYDFYSASEGLDADLGQF